MFFKKEKLISKTNPRLKYGVKNNKFRIRL
jgi:hypothetical protein